MRVLGSWLEIGQTIAPACSTRVVQVAAGHQHAVLVIGRKVEGQTNMPDLAGIKVV